MFYFLTCKITQSHTSSSQQFMQSLYGWFQIETEGGGKDGKKHFLLIYERVSPSVHLEMLHPSREDLESGYNQNTQQLKNESLCSWIQRNAFRNELENENWLQLGHVTGHWEEYVYRDTRKPGSLLMRRMLPCSTTSYCQLQAELLWHGHFWGIIFQRTLAE